MKAIKTTDGSLSDDAALVHGTLEGNRDAFREIVARYQALICSLTYSGTGSISRSEDIAQDTFVTAWRRLRELREPASLRSWLCGIARHLVSNSQRRARREPVEIAEPIDPVREITAPDRSPSDQVIRQEEEAMLWRALGTIPENYREPLILYYRRHRSVEQVAGELGLSVDATKQRLSRGRALLQEQVLACIEGTLEKTEPRAAFTTAVMSALPIMGPALAATAGASTAKGSSAAKAGIAGGAGFFAAIFGFFAALGGYVGWQMSASNAQSESERMWSARFWRCLVLAIVAVFVPALVLLVVAGRAGPWVPAALSFYLAAGYVLVAVPFGIWAWTNHRRIRGRPDKLQTGESRALLGATLGFAALAIGGTLRFGYPSGHWTDLWLTIVFAIAVMIFTVWVRDLRQRRTGQSAEQQPKPAKRLSLAWVGAATVCMAALLVFSIGGGWRRVKRVSPQVALEMIAAHPNARIDVSEYERGPRTIDLTVEVDGRSTRYLSTADDATLATLNRAGIPYRTLRQGRDFERLGSGGRYLWLVSLIAVTAGLVILARALRKRLRPDASAAHPPAALSPDSAPSDAA